MTISILVAVSENNIIGMKGQLPWLNLPADKKLFKSLTTGHHVIMGRKTYESLGKPLSNRTNIIITRQNDYHAPGALIVHSLEDALKIANENGEDEAFIIGGAEIYRIGIAVTDKIYLTRIHNSFEGDAHFDEVDMQEWKLSEEQLFKKDDVNPYDYTFVSYKRVSK